MALAVLVVVFLVAAVSWRLLVDAIHRGVVERLALAPGMSVADIGSGPGRLAVRIGKKVGPTGEVVGIDINAEAVRRAERLARKAGLSNARFINAGAEGGRLGQNRFDRAVLVAVLGEIQHRDAAMAAIYRALKPDGLLSVTEVAFDPHRRRVEDVRALASAAGFIEQAVRIRHVACTVSFRKP